MNDDELSNLLQEWKRTPAPPSLDARVFGSGKKPLPGWWDGLPASRVAAVGIAAGVLTVWGLIALAPSRSNPPAPVQVAQSVDPLVEQTAPKELPANQTRPLQPSAPSRARPPATGTRPSFEGARPQAKSVRVPVTEIQPTTDDAVPKAKGRAMPTAVRVPRTVSINSPRLLSGAGPNYPADATALPLTTTVKLRIRIGKDGRVIDAEAIDGDPVLSPLAIQAVKEWLYEPRMEQGEPTEVVTEIDVTFASKKEIRK